ncbi:PREDICTED: zona pellucida sperm-binding protein 3-like, partial [Pterocles gutturalis]|uniref:zona pellucida sperm-binding protein 3-like n=1 Tax=Pterocles gutturalis TaxID=240206 RepID=UPI0005287135
SAFITPRPREDVLRFRIDVFRFAGDTRNLIYITCHLKVTPADQAPDPLNKACSFNKARNTWAPVEGTRDICSCCETGH